MYERGQNRLFYQSNLEFPQNVTATVINPKLETSGPFKMIYISDGLYYLDVFFSELGSHVFYVYEEDVKKCRYILRVDSGKYLVYPHGNIV